MPTLITATYKYNRYAPLLVIVYCAATILLFTSSAVIPSPVLVLLIILFLAIPVYAAVKPRSIFSLRYVDEKKLSFTKDHLAWGEIKMPVTDLEKLEVYIYAFESFRHRVIKTSKISSGEYGDKNTLSFVYQGKSYDYTFYLGTYQHYKTLLQIIKEWKANGVSVSVRSAFEQDYIEGEMKALGLKG